jgi:hypothetical protein
MILINRTFEIVTEESAADGDAAERGMLASNEAVTFRELVSMLRYGEASEWPASGEAREWVTQDQGETRAFFERGEREAHSIHYSRDNAAHKARYWRLAFIAAALVPRGAP